MEKIVIEKYNYKWKKEFKLAKKFYNKLLKKIENEVVHVGSTSVEGLCAKPILDIDIIVNSKDDLKNAIILLESVGYKHVGNMGIEGRETFEYKSNNINIKWMKHHLYLCIRGNENLRNHLLLKKHLENNIVAVKEYSQLKRKLAERYSNDIDSYIEGKTEFITGILKEEGMKLEEVLKIETINKKAYSRKKSNKHNRAK